MNNEVILRGEVANAYPSETNAPSRFTVKTVDTRDGKTYTSYISCKSFEGCPTVGSKVVVNARIQTGSYEKDGKKIYTTDIMVNNFTVAEEAVDYGNIPF
ncbi:MAG: single-stranded DNA-binding protein [Enterococcus sp.]|nr:single-stranded DNA-binding protein [Enterococcus sp.]